MIGDSEAGDHAGPLNPSLTRQELCAKAEDLAVEITRWNAWRVEGNSHENPQDAQALQALAMTLLELLDLQRGSRQAAHSELTRAVTLLGYVLQDTLRQRQDAAQEQLEDALFLRTHGLRLETDTP